MYYLVFLYISCYIAEIWIAFVTVYNGWACLITLNAPDNGRTCLTSSYVPDTLLSLSHISAEFELWWTFVPFWVALLLVGWSNPKIIWDSGGLLSRVGRNVFFSHSFFTFKENIIHQFLFTFYSLIPVRYHLKNYIFKDSFAWPNVKSNFFM